MLTTYDVILQHMNRTYWCFAWTFIDPNGDELSFGDCNRGLFEGYLFLSDSWISESTRFAALSFKFDEEGVLHCDRILG